MTRSGLKRAMLYELGAVPVVADAVAIGQVAEAVARLKLEVIVHQLTAISAVDPRRRDRAFALWPQVTVAGENDDSVSAAGSPGHAGPASSLTVSTARS